MNSIIGMYELRTCWYEVVECVRKLLLVALPVFFPEGSNIQLNVSLFISFVSTAVVVGVWPYRDPEVGVLMTATQVQVFISLLSTNLLRGSERDDGEQEVRLVVHAPHCFALKFLSDEQYTYIQPMYLRL